MTEQTYLLPIWETISTAWEKVHGTKGSAWGAMLVIIAITLAISTVSVLMQPFLPDLAISIGILIPVAVFFLQMGLLYIGIQRALDYPFSFRLVFYAYHFSIAIRLIGVYLLEILLFLPFFILLQIAALLYTPAASLLIMLCAALLYFIATVGTVYLSFRFLLAIAFVLDKKLNSWQAIKSSFIATRANFWRLVAVSLIESLILIVSAIPLGIGLIWTLPLVLIVYGLIYKNLLMYNMGRSIPSH